MSNPKTFSIGGVEIEPITSPGPCSICGKPADGLSFMGSPDGRVWQLCGEKACWDAADKQQDTHDDLLALQRWVKGAYDGSPGAYERMKIVERLMATHAPRPTDADKAARVIPGGLTFTVQLAGNVQPAPEPAVDAGDQGGDRAYLLLTLQWVEEKLRQHPDHPTLRGQRSALIGAVDRAMPPAENVPGPIFQKAGPEAVALRLRHADVDRAHDALGDYFSDRPEIGNDAQLCQLAIEAESALSELNDAISTKLRKLCGVES